MPKGLAPRLESATGRALTALSRGLAVAGGVALAAAALMTVVSITGRALIPLGLGPVPGDFELLSLASAFAVFSFLPYSQITRGQVSVDVLANLLPARARIALGMLGDLAMALAAGVIVWRLWLGLGERLPYGSDHLRAWLGLGARPYYVETGYILGMPVWWGYALAIPGAALFAVVCAYTVWRALNWVLQGQETAVEG